MLYIESPTKDKRELHVTSSGILLHSHKSTNDRQHPHKASFMPKIRTRTIQLFNIRDISVC